MYGQMIQPLCEEESSSMLESSSHPNFPSTYNMTMQQPQVQSMYAAPFQSTYMPDVSAHEANHHFESSSQNKESSSHHLFSEQQAHPNFVSQQPATAGFLANPSGYNPMYSQPHSQMKGEDCGCGGSKSLTNSPKTQMQPMNAGQSMMGSQPMNAGQSMMGSQPMSPGQSMMGSQPMNSGQSTMNKQPMNQSQQTMPTQQSVNPFQSFKSRANPGNVPFLNLEENVYSGMQQPSTSDVLEMPRYADESDG